MFIEHCSMRLFNLFLISFYHATISLMSYSSYFCRLLNFLFAPKWDFKYLVEGAGLSPNLFAENTFGEERLQSSRDNLPSVENIYLIDAMQ